MLEAKLLNSLKSGAYVTGRERGAACLDLDVDAAVWQDNLDIFIALNHHLDDVCGLSLKQAADREQVLIEKAAVNSGNPFFLSFIEREECGCHRIVLG
ncbi:hypothetical protein D9M68_861430 [compost metagenome]